MAALRYDGRLEAMAEGALRRRERRLLLRGFGGWARWAVGSRESAARGRSQEEILQLSAEVVRADRITAGHSPNSLAAWLPGCLAAWLPETERQHKKWRRLYLPVLCHGHS